MKYKRAEYLKKRMNFVLSHVIIKRGYVQNYKGKGSEKKVAQILAVIIFLVMFGLIIMEVWERHVVTLVSALMVLIFVLGLGLHSPAAMWETINVKSICMPEFWYKANEVVESSKGINWETILFIIGMMIMVEGMAHVGFFRWLCMRIAKLVKYKVSSIYITFMLLSVVLAMFIDSITVILFLAAVTIELSQLLKFNPTSMIMAEIFCANLGGAATMCGDPPNIIIGTSLGYSFSDFVQNTGIIVAISVPVVIVYFYLVERRQFRKGKKNSVDTSQFPEPEEAITDKKGFIISTLIFLLAIVLLVTHAQTGLTVSTIGVFIGVLTLLVAGKGAWGLLKKVDFKTILFFIGLFVVVGGLEETEVLETMAQFIGRISSGNIALMLAIILWISAIASAFVDNIPFSATMIPIIRSLAATQGVDLSVLSWALAMGTDIGGSATPIGASANVVGIAAAAREGHIIKWGRYCKIMVPATTLVLLIAMVVLYVGCL